MYGEVKTTGNDEDDLIEEPDSVLHTARMIGFYKRIYNFLKRVYLVINKII